MKRLITAVFALCFLLCVQPANAQHKCGTDHASQVHGLERLLQNRAIAAQNNSAGQRDELVYVPVKFHLVANTAGSGRANQSQIFDLLCTLNEEYADQDIQFYFDFPFNDIDNDALYNSPDETGGTIQISANKVSNAMNIFITQQTSGPNTLGYYQGPWPSNDYIVIRKTAIYGNTAAHEVGHFFSLAHPFFGWENNAWDPAEHGMQVGTFAPNSSGQFQIFNEYQNGGNCNTAADYICDTPPDYLFAFSDGQNGCTEWNGGTMDPQGNVVNPQEANMMSYFDDCNDFIFTEDQKTAMRQDYESSQRAYIRTNYTPSTTPITEAPTLVSPIQGETTSGFDQVAFDWDPVDGADYYLLEIDLLPNFSNDPIRYMVDGTYKIVTELFANAPYYWRVTPVGEYVSCNLPTSENGEFTTGATTSTNNIDFVKGWNLSPNPVTSQSSVLIELESNESFVANIQMYTLTGQLVKTINNHRFNANGDLYELNIADINNGMYLLRIQTEEGQLTKRLVVSR